MADLEIPEGFTAPSAPGIAAPEGFTPQPAYSGSILPFSRDASGKISFDSNAGILGSLASALTAPADVYTGRLPIMDASGQPNPQMIDRAINFAALASPPSPAGVSGAMIPGESRASVGAPSATQLKAAGGAAYNAIRDTGYEVTGQSIGDLASGLKTNLTAESGIIGKNAPKTFGILDELANPPQGSTVGFPAIQAARQGLRDISMEGGTEGKAARAAISAIDGFLASPPPAAAVAGTAPPEAVAQMFRDANANYAAAQRSNSLTGELTRGNTGIAEQAEARAHASHSGQNIGNSIRQRVASFLQNENNLAGFSQPEIDALNGVVQGSRLQNAARYGGNLLGGGGGIGGAVIGALMGHYLGGGGEEGMLLGLTGGRALKGIDNALALRGLNAVDEMVRARSPLAAQIGAQYAPAIGRDQAIWKAILQPGLLGPQPQPTPPATGLLGPAA